MPKIIINEFDNTVPGVSSYTNFTVVVPGKVGTEATAEFDENGIVKLVPGDDFKSLIGIVAAGPDGDSAVSGEAVNHYGNQIAKLLLSEGYTILYKKLTYINDLNTDAYWACLKDKSIYDFRYIITGLLDGNDLANTAIASLAAAINKDINVDVKEYKSNGRGDCIALLDIPTSAYEGAATQEAAITGIISKLSGGNKFSAFFAPSVTYSFEDNDYNNSTFPASVHYLLCAANAFNMLNFNEWFAVAGYTRGICRYTVSKTGYKFGDFAVNALQPRASYEDGPACAVNLIIKNREGYYLWGNRTAKTLGTELIASDFLNIRQLCTTLKKQIYVACRKFTFDPNSDMLWINFVGAIEPTLKDMKANQGIRDYKFIKVKTKFKGVLKVKIRIVPIEAVEDFNIGVYLEDNINGTTIEVVDEDTAE